MTWRVSRLPQESELRGLFLLPQVWSLGGGEGHWLPFQRLTHLLDSILQHSR